MCKKIMQLLLTSVTVLCCVLLVTFIKCNVNNNEGVMDKNRAYSEKELLSLKKTWSLSLSDLMNKYSDCELYEYQERVLAHLKSADNGNLFILFSKDSNRECTAMYSWYYNKI